MSLLIPMVCLLVLSISNGLPLSDDGQLMQQLEGGMTVDQVLRFDPYPVTGSCQCENSSCGCCHHIKHFHIDNEVCINVKYLKKETGALLTVTWGGRVVYQKEISVKNPPALCFNVPFVKHLASVCIQLYNLKYDKGFSGCARLSLRFLVIKPWKIDVGCFNIPVSENEMNSTNSSPSVGVNGEMSPRQQNYDVRQRSVRDEQEIMSSAFRELKNERSYSIESSDYFSYIFGGSFTKHERKTFTN